MRRFTTLVTTLAGTFGALLLTGCGGKESANEATTTNFVPPAVRPPTPVAGQAQTTPLSAYVGKYPHDAVGGVDFFDRTDVANGLINAVGDEAVRALVRGRAGPQTPIFNSGTRIASWGCEAHDCGDHNWTLLIAPKDGKTEVCYHDAAKMGDTSRWYAGQAPVSRPGGCPSEGGPAEG